MKKILLSLITLSSFLNGQVGIGTTSPSVNSILDLKSESKGLLIPRMTSVQRNSIMPFSTDLGLQVYDVTTNSFWSWNGSSWIQAASGANIYNSDGIVGSNRNISISDRINLGNGLLYLDKANNKIGINNSTPSYQLDVNGILGAGSGGKIEINNDGVNGSIVNKTGSMLFYNTANANYIYHSNGIEMMRLNNNGNLGIGTSTPTRKLHVQGDMTLTGKLYDGNNSPGDASKILSTDGTKLIWQTSTAVRYAQRAIFPQTTSNYTIGSPNYNTGTSIILPPGKWSVQASILINMGTIDNSVTGVFWIRSTLSSSASVINTSDVEGATLFSGSLTAPSSFGMCNGTIIINNTSGSNKTYYLWRTNSNSYGNSVNNNYPLINFGTGIAGEDQIIAYPMNS